MCAGCIRAGMVFVYVNNIAPLNIFNNVQCQVGTKVTVIDEMPFLTFEKRKRNLFCCLKNQEQKLEIIFSVKIFESRKRNLPYIPFFREYNEKLPSLSLLLRLEREIKILLLQTLIREITSQFFDVAPICILGQLKLMLSLPQQAPSLLQHFAPKLKIILNNSGKNLLTSRSLN